MDGESVSSLTLGFPVLMRNAFNGKDKDDREPPPPIWLSTLTCPLFRSDYNDAENRESVEGSEFYPFLVPLPKFRIEVLKLAKLGLVLSNAL